MIDYDVCQKILESEGGQYTKEETKQVTDFLWQLANLSVENFLNQVNKDLYEKCDSDGQGKF